MDACCWTYLKVASHSPLGGSVENFRDFVLHYGDESLNNTSLHSRRGQ